jgi:hypothetical protein
VNLLPPGHCGAEFGTIGGLGGVDDMKSLLLVFWLALAAFSQSAPVALRDFPFTADESRLDASGAYHLHGNVALTIPTIGVIQADDLVYDTHANSIAIHGDSHFVLRSAQ